MVSPNPHPARHYLVLIAECDRMLALLRELWLQATRVAERADIWQRIDRVLDERLKLMRSRDMLVAASEKKLAA
jgi:hypothetical protein